MAPNTASVQTSAHTKTAGAHSAATTPYPVAMLAALVAADLDYEVSGAVTPETMALIRDLLAEAGVV